MKATKIFDILKSAYSFYYYYYYRLKSSHTRICTWLESKSFKLNLTMTEKNLEATMLEKIMCKLPKFSTKCTTAQHKTVQHNAYDTPKEYWCCWVTDPNGQKFFAMYDNKNVKIVSEEKRKSYIVKKVKE